tara:strand:- start:4057 stop:4581 length:525 start_codon:yes stop_codon:yes gene_type:complete
MIFRPKRYSIVNEALMALTRNTSQALLLNQFLYWTRRCYEFDEMLMAENYCRKMSKRLPVNITPRDGWFTITLARLAEEAMLVLSKESLQGFIKILVQRGWVEQKLFERESPDQKYYYRVNLYQLEMDLGKLGHEIPGFVRASKNDFGGPLSDSTKDNAFYHKSDYQCSFSKTQ